MTKWHMVIEYISCISFSILRAGQFRMILIGVNVSSSGKIVKQAFSNMNQADISS
jgi:uncharacterized membrane protein YjjB (DUF3815 family)